jgi:hypothetical protein
MWENPNTGQTIRSLPQVSWRKEPPHETTFFNLRWRGLAVKTWMLVVAVAAICIIILAAAMTLLNPRSPENATIGGLGDTGMMASIHRYCDGKGIYSKHGLNVTYVPFRDSYTMALALFTEKIDSCFTSTGLAGHSRDACIACIVSAESSDLAAKFLRPQIPQMHMNR